MVFIISSSSKPKCSKENRKKNTFLPILCELFGMGVKGWKGDLRRSGIKFGHGLNHLEQHDLLTLFFTFGSWYVTS